MARAPLLTPSSLAAARTTRAVPGTTGRTARRGGAWDLRAWSAACGMSSATACSGVGHGNAPQGAGLTAARGDRNRGPCSTCPAGYDAGTWLGRAAMGDGFVALYIFLMAASAGNVNISREVGRPRRRGSV